MFSDHQAALQTLLSREMTRRQFLLYVAGIVVGLIGITSFLDTLLKPQTKSRSSANGAYGGGAYGGSASSQTTLKGLR